MSQIASKLGYTFDSDSFKIGVDNHSSFSLSNCRDHFVGPITPLNANLLGINGVSAIKGRGTICWTIEDDDGVPHTITLHNALYVPSSPVCLLSPQHWAQVVNDHYPLQEGTWCATYSKSVVLHWDQRKFCRTIPINSSTNTPVFMSSPGTTHARCSIALLDDAFCTPALEKTYAYCSLTTPSLSNPPVPPQHVIPPDDNSVDMPPPLVAGHDPPLLLCKTERICYQIPMIPRYSTLSHRTPPHPHRVLLLCVPQVLLNHPLFPSHLIPPRFWISFRYPPCLPG